MLRYREGNIPSLEDGGVAWCPDPECGFWIQAPPQMSVSATIRHDSGQHLIEGLTVRYDDIRFYLGGDGEQTLPVLDTWIVTTPGGDSAGRPRPLIADELNRVREPATWTYEVVE